MTSGDSKDLWEFGTAINPLKVFRQTRVPRLHPSPKLFYHSSHGVVKGLVGGCWRGGREDAFLFPPIDFFAREGVEDSRRKFYFEKNLSLYLST